jgi:hypothetical protein
MRVSSIRFRALWSLTESPKLFQQQALPSKSGMNQPETKLFGEGLFCLPTLSGYAKVDFPAAIVKPLFNPIAKAKEL